MSTQANHEILDDVSYMGLKDVEDHLQLYTCMHNSKAFKTAVLQKLKRNRREDHIRHIKKNSLRGHLIGTVPAIAACLNLTVVTNFQTDHLLTVRQKEAWFVYFGAMTAELIHVACWLRVPRMQSTDGLTGRPKVVVDNLNSPKIFFWVLHTSYAQELEALGEANEGVNMEAIKQHLDLTKDIEYTQSV